MGVSTMEIDCELKQRLDPRLAMKAISNVDTGAEAARGYDIE